MDEAKRKEQIQQTFNMIAVGYESPSLRFFKSSADFLPDLFRFRGDEHVLDVATGTGLAATSLALNLPRGWVTGIDFSTGMLAEAQKKADQLANLELRQMDMQDLQFPDDHFDAANCSFGLFFIEDMVGLVRHIASKLKPGGRMISCTFAENAFQPLQEMFLTSIERYGVERPPLRWKELNSEAKSAEFFGRAGLTDIRAHRRDASFHLKDASEWWEVVWNAGFRGLVNQLDKEQLKRFKPEHLAEIQALADNEGIPLNVELIFVEGKRS